MVKSLSNVCLPKNIRKTAVIKIGSSVLSSPAEKLGIKRRIISNIARQVSIAMDKGWRVAIVSSGAVACGMARLGLKRRPKDIATLQVCASIGQVALMDAYVDAFKRFSIDCSQVLLTADDLRDRDRFLNVNRTMNAILERDIVPIVNENDCVSVQEITFGDNDNLSALVAGCLDAGALVILSDVDGVYTSLDMRRVIPVIEDIEAFDIEAIVFKKTGRTTLGGMLSKLMAGRVASQWGVVTFICNGRSKDNIEKFLASDECPRGTLILPRQRAKRRLMWIAFVGRPKGRIIVDDGAASAIKTRRVSLLSVGITAVEGIFDNGDVVEIVNKRSEVVGKGIVNFTHSLLRENIGKRMDKEVVHRDNMVVF